MIFFNSATKLLVAASLIIAPTAVSAQACQGTGCVLPLAPPAPPPPAFSAPVQSLPVEAIAVEPVARGGISILALLLAGVAAAVALYLILDNDDNDDVEAPVSP